MNKYAPILAALLFILPLATPASAATPPSEIDNTDAGLTYPTDPIDFQDIESMDPLYTSRNWYKRLVQAQLCVRLKNYDGAESNFLKTLDEDLAQEVRRSILLSLAADVYAPQDLTHKIIIVYEKFAETFPKDPILAQILLQLGCAYRKAGLTSLAINRFYSVMQMALAIKSSEIPRYKKLIVIAQREIVATYLDSQDYANASSTLSRIRLEELNDADKSKTLYQMALCSYNLQNFTDVIQTVELFRKYYKNSPLAAECLFLLSNAYRKLHKDTEAVRIVIDLLKYTPNTKEKTALDTWQYWQKRTANELGNDFYNKGDYENALQIYQTLAPISNAPEWQLPVVYQIGLCFERLQQFTLARKSYTFIANNPTNNSKNKNDPALSSLLDMAQWRLQNLDWIEKTRGDTNSLLHPALPSQKASIH